MFVLAPGGTRKPVCVFIGHVPFGPSWPAYLLRHSQNTATFPDLQPVCQELVQELLRTCRYLDLPDSKVGLRSPAPHSCSFSSFNSRSVFPNHGVGVWLKVRLQVQPDPSRSQSAEVQSLDRPLPSPTLFHSPTPPRPWALTPVMLHKCQASWERRLPQRRWKTAAIV